MKKYFLIFMALLGLQFSYLGAEVSAETSKPVKRILVGSPIRQKPAILKEFLDSLARLEKEGFTLDYYFTDDNTLSESSELLVAFAKNQEGKSTTLIIPGSDNLSHYECSEVTHCWKEELVWKVANFKDQMLKFALEKEYDYIFLIDSDLVLHPKTVEQLLSDNKDIVSNIFWTRWTPESSPLPQVWLSDHYTLFHREINEEVTPAEATKRTLAFLDQLQKPGLYEVGGLGACTLISKEALKRGVNFKRIKNVMLWGEDRHFCIRAQAMGLSLHVDTQYPAYHIYRESALSGVEKFKEEAVVKKEVAAKKNQITLMMVMHNESAHYLRPMLEDAKRYIDAAVIIDDASTDDSVEICREILKDIPLHIIHNSVSKFSNEVNLRKQAWEETGKINPGWIVALDADQMFEKAFATGVKELVTDDSVDAYYFRLYDMWDEEHYRDDQYWQAHNTYRPFLVRYKPGMEYVWRETRQHCGHFPLNVSQLPMKLSKYRLKHYGWAKKEDRIAKYARYQKLDPDAKFGWKEQYESILDEHPPVVAWRE